MKSLYLYSRILFRIAMFLLPFCGRTASVEIEEMLGRAWSNELVSFPVTDEMARHIGQNHALCDEAGAARPYQTLDGEQVALRIDLAPGQVRTFTFDPDRQAPEIVTDLEIEETEHLIRLSTSKIGLSLRRQLEGKQGPIAGIRLGRDNWVGDSTLPGDFSEHKYEMEVTRRGPLQAEAVCRLISPDGAVWQTVFRLQAGEPVIVIAEDFSQSESAPLDLELAESWTPTHLLYRYGKSGDGKRVGTVATAPLAELPGDPVFILEPWIHWWERFEQGNWAAFYTDQGGDMLTIAAFRPSVWVDPEQPRSLRNNIRTRLEADDGTGGITARFRGQKAQRSWLLGAFEAEEVLGAIDFEDRASLNTAPVPQQYLVKHGHFPLEKVNRMILKWEYSTADRPRLFLDEASLEEFRARYVPDENEFKAILRTPIRPYRFDDIFYHYLGGGNDELEAKLVEAAVSMGDRMADRIYRQDDLVYYGFAPHHHNHIRSCAMIADLIWKSDHLSAGQRSRLLAQLAFIAYAVSTPDYWSPERGFSANPNMTTFVASYQAVLGALLENHPESSRWLSTGIDELIRQANNWSGPNGGWLEAPHYCMAAFDPIVMYFLMAHRMGLNDLLYSETVQKTALWMAKISTPPDARLKGWRHVPPIGNTYKLEPTGEFGLLAALWRNRLPERAAEMAWLHREHGSYPTPGVGGFAAASAGYRRIFNSIEVEPKAPAWGSEIFPNAGALFRSHFPSERETMLYMIAGRFHAHYDDDSGSITFWGKGKILCDDFGYTGRAPGSDHSMLVSPSAPDRAIMNVETFETTGGIDFLLGEKRSWQRRLVFVRDKNPLGPNYLVISDRLAKPDSADWRLFFTAQNVELTDHGAAITGEEDVDANLYILARPDDSELSRETLTRETWGLNSEARYGRTSSTQTAVKVSWNAGDHLLAVLYPRLRNEPAPRVTALEHGVKISTATSTDYIFLAPEPVHSEVDGIVFQGTVGSVKLREGQPPQLYLAQSGTLRFDGQEEKR